MASTGKRIAAVAALLGAVVMLGTGDHVGAQQPRKRHLNRVIDHWERGLPAIQGVDWAFLEMEHSNFDMLQFRDTLQFMLDRRQIAEAPDLAPPITPIVRLPANADEQNLWMFKQVLDLGVYGVVVPHFGHSVEAARAIVSAVRYASAKGEPRGHRGVSPGAFQYWGFKSFNDYAAAADVWPLNPDGEIALIGLIEDKEGLEHVGEVLREVKGISGIWIGEVDMSTSLGVAGENPSQSEGSAASLKEAVGKVAELAKQYKVPFGTLTNRRNIVERAVAGHRWLAGGGDDPVIRAEIYKAIGQTEPKDDVVPVSSAGHLNRVVDLLAAGKPVFGSFVANADPSAAMAARDSGWDFAIFEMEHTGFSMSGLRKSLQYMLSRAQIRQDGLKPRVVPFVRVGPGAGEVRANMGYIQQVLDMGVYGLVVPHLDSVQHANDVLQAIRFPPAKGAPAVGPRGLRGYRSGLTSIAQAYWGLPNFKEYYTHAGVWPLDPDGDIVLAPLVEDAAGAAAIKDILRDVKGISVVFIGPADLATSLGYTNQPEHPAVRKVVEEIAQACRDAKVPFGITTGRDRVEAEVRSGYQFMVTGDAGAIELGRKAGSR